MSVPRFFPNCRVRVDHSSYLVALDLREALLECGAQSVVVGKPTLDLRPDAGVDLWVYQSCRTSADTAALIAARKPEAKVQMIVTSGPGEVPPGLSDVIELPQPFGLETIYRLLRKTGLIAPAAG